MSADEHGPGGPGAAQPLLEERRGAVAVLTLNRPAAKNALDGAVLGALAEALGRLDRDDTVRAVVLTGAGGVFCAGADITSFLALRAMELLGERAAVGGTVFETIGTLGTPLIAAIEGLALGGGCELMLGADIVVAARSARIGLPEVGLGVIPGGGGTQRLIRAIGRTRAMTMLLTGRPIDAETAERYGLVAALAEDGQALATAVAIGAQIAANSPLAVALAKDAALAAFETGLAQGFQIEKRNFHHALASADSRAGEEAFRTRTTPTFTGK